MSAFPQPWSQSGRLSLWRYTPKLRMYSGWHVAADVEGCDSVLALLDAFASDGLATHRTLSVTDPLSVGVDRIFGEHDLKVRHPAKLRLAFDPTLSSANPALYEALDRVTLTMGPKGLEAVREAVTDLRAGEADFGMGLADDDSLSFWWWPK